MKDRTGKRRKHRVSGGTGRRLDSNHESRGEKPNKIKIWSKKEGKI